MIYPYLFILSTPFLMKLILFLKVFPKIPIIVYSSSLSFICAEFTKFLLMCSIELFLP